jgi:hypothetical protein
MLKKAFELCGGFKLYKAPPQPPQLDLIKSPSENMSTIPEVHKRASRRLVLCFDGIAIQDGY